MSLQLPDELRTMFLIVTGDTWPAADEDVMRAVAADLRGLAADLSALDSGLADASAATLSTFAGPAADSFARSVREVLDHGVSEQVAAGMEQLALQVDEQALQVEYVKILIIGQLVMLAAQILFLIATAKFSFGASLAGIPALVNLGRTVAQRLVAQLFGRVAGRAAFLGSRLLLHAGLQGAIGVGMQVGLDALAQVSQMLMGTRDHWSADLTRSAAVTGGIGGAVGFVGFGGARLAGARLRGAIDGSDLARGVDRFTGHRVVSTAGEVIGDASHELSTDLLSTLAQTGSIEGSSWLSATAGGIEGLVEGLGKRGRPGADATPGEVAVPALSEGGGAAPSTGTAAGSTVAGSTVAGSTPAGSDVPAGADPLPLTEASAGVGPASTPNTAAVPNGPATERFVQSAGPDAARAVAAGGVLTVPPAGAGVAVAGSGGATAVAPSGVGTPAPAPVVPPDGAVVLGGAPAMPPDGAPVTSGSTPTGSPPSGAVASAGAVVLPVHAAVPVPGSVADALGPVVAPLTEPGPVPPAGEGGPAVSPTPDGTAVPDPPPDAAALVGPAPVAPAGGPGPVTGSGSEPSPGRPATGPQATLDPGPVAGSAVPAGVPPRPTLEGPGGVTDALASGPQGNGSVRHPDQAAGETVDGARGERGAAEALPARAAEPSGAAPTTPASDRPAAAGPLPGVAPVAPGSGGLVPGPTGPVAPVPGPPAPLSTVVGPVAAGSGSAQPQTVGPAAPSTGVGDHGRFPPTSSAAAAAPSSPVSTTGAPSGTPAGASAPHHPAPVGTVTDAGAVAPGPGEPVSPSPSAWSTGTSSPAQESRPAAEGPAPEPGSAAPAVQTGITGGGGTPAAVPPASGPAAPASAGPAATATVAEQLLVAEGEGPSTAPVVVARADAAAPDPSDASRGVPSAGAVGDGAGATAPQAGVDPAAGGSGTGAAAGPDGVVPTTPAARPSSPGPVPGGTPIAAAAPSASPPGAAPGAAAPAAPGSLPAASATASPTPSTAQRGTLPLGDVPRSAPPPAVVPAVVPATATAEHAAPVLPTTAAAGPPAAITVTVPSVTGPALVAQDPAVPATSTPDRPSSGPPVHGRADHDLPATGPAPGGVASDRAPIPGPEVQAGTAPSGAPVSGPIAGEPGSATPPGPDWRTAGTGPGDGPPIGQPPAPVVEGEPVAVREVPAGLLLGADRGSPLRFAEAMRPDPVRFTVFVGQPGGPLTPASLADLAARIEQDPRWTEHRRPVTLVGAGLATGGPVSPAAALATLLGVPVHAPPTTVWTGLNGEFFVAPETRSGEVVAPARFRRERFLTFGDDAAGAPGPPTRRAWRDRDLLPWRDVGWAAPAPAAQAGVDLPAVAPTPVAPTPVDPTPVGSVPVASTSTAPTAVASTPVAPAPATPAPAVAPSGSSPSARPAPAVPAAVPPPVGDLAHAPAAATPDRPAAGPPAERGPTPAPPDRAPARPLPPVPEHAAVEPARLERARTTGVPRITPPSGLQPQGSFGASDPVAPPRFFVELGGLGQGGLVGGLTPLQDRGTTVVDAVRDSVADALREAAPRLASTVVPQLAEALAALGATTTEAGSSEAAVLARLVEGLRLRAGDTPVVVEVALVTTPHQRAAARRRPIVADPSALGERSTAWQTHTAVSAAARGTGRSVGTTMGLAADVVVPVAGPLLATAGAGPFVQRRSGGDHAIDALGGRTAVRRVVGAGRLVWFGVRGELQVTLRGLPGDPRPIPPVPVQATVGFPVEQAAIERPEPAAGRSTATTPEPRLGGLLAGTSAAVEAAGLDALRAAVLDALPAGARAHGGPLADQVSDQLTEAELIGFADDVFGGGHTSSQIPLRGGGTLTLTTSVTALSVPQRIPGDASRRVLRFDRRLETRSTVLARAALGTTVGLTATGGVTLTGDSGSRLLRARVIAAAAHAQQGGRGQQLASQLHIKRFLQYAGRVGQFRTTAQVRVDLASDDPALNGSVVADVPLHLVVPEADVAPFLARAAADGTPAPVPADARQRLLPPAPMANGTGYGSGAVDQLDGAHRVLPEVLVAVAGFRTWNPTDLATIRRQLESALTLGGLAARQESLLTRAGVVATVEVDGEVLDVAVRLRPGELVHTGHRDGYTTESETEQSDSLLTPEEWTRSFGGALGLDVRVPFAGARLVVGAERETGRRVVRGHGTGTNSGIAHARRMQLFEAAGTWEISVSRGTGDRARAELPGHLRIQVPDGLTRPDRDPRVGRAVPQEPGAPLVPAPGLRPGADTVLEVLGSDAVLTLVRRALGPDGLGVDVSGPVRALVSALVSPEKLRGDWHRFSADDGHTVVLPGAGRGRSDVVLTIKATMVPESAPARPVPAVGSWREVQTWSARESTSRTRSEVAAGVGASTGRTAVGTDPGGSHLLAGAGDHSWSRARGRARAEALRVRSGYRVTARPDATEHRARDVVWHVVAGPAGGAPTVRATRVRGGVQYLHRPAAVPAVTAGPAAVAPAAGADGQVLSPMARTVALSPRAGEAAPALADRVTELVAAVAPQLLGWSWRLQREGLADGAARYSWTAVRDLDAALRHALSADQLALAMPTLLAAGAALPLQAGGRGRAGLQLLLTAERTGDYVRTAVAPGSDMQPYHAATTRSATATLQGWSRRAGIAGDYASYRSRPGADAVVGQVSVSARRSGVSTLAPEGRAQVQETKLQVQAPVVVHRGEVVLRAQLVATAPAGLFRGLGPVPALRWRHRPGDAAPVREATVRVVEDVVAPLPVHAAERLSATPRPVEVRPLPATPPPWTEVPAGPRRAAVLGIDGGALRGYTEVLRTGVLAGPGVPAALRGLVRGAADGHAVLATLFDPATLLGNVRALSGDGLALPLGYREGVTGDLAGEVRVRWSFGEATVVGMAAGRFEHEQRAVDERSTRIAARTTATVGALAGGYALLDGSGGSDPAATTTRLAPVLGIGGSADSTSRVEHVVGHSRASAVATGGPHLLVRADLRLTVEMRAWRTGAGGGRDRSGAPVRLVHELPGAGLLAVPAARARDLGVQPEGGELTHTGWYLPPRDPAARDVLADVLPQFAGWQTVALHMTEDGRAENGTDDLTAEDLVEVLARAVGTGALRGPAPLVLVPRGGATERAPDLARRVRDLTGRAVIVTAGRARVHAEPGFYATGPDGPVPWLLMPARGPETVLGHDLVAALAARGSGASRPSGWARHVVRQAVGSTRLETTHHPRTLLLRPAKLAESQVRLAQRLPGFDGASVLVGWSDAGRLVVGDPGGHRHTGAPPNQVLGARRLAAWLDEHGVPRDGPLVLAVGGVGDLAAALHAVSGRDVIATDGLWALDGADRIVATASDGSPATWVRHRTGAPRTDLGPDLTAALRAAGHEPVPAPAGGRVPAPPPTTVAPLHAPLSDLHRALLGRAAADDVRGGRPPVHLVPVGPDARAGAEVWEDARSESEVWEDARSEPDAGEDPLPGTVAAERTHYGHVLTSPHLSADAVRYAGRLPQLPGWEILVAASADGGRVLAGEDALDAAGLADALDALGVPAGAPVVLVVPQGSTIAGELAAATGRAVIATAGAVQLGPDGRARAVAAPSSVHPVPHWWQLHLGDGSTVALGRDLADALARYGTPVGPERAPIDRALAERPASDTSASDTPADGVPADGGGGNGPARDPDRDQDQDQDPDEDLAWSSHAGAADPAPAPGTADGFRIERQVTPQPEEPPEPEQYIGTVYSAGLVDDPAAAAVLAPGAVLTPGGALGFTDPAALPVDTAVMARIDGVTGHRLPGSGVVAIPPGRSFVVRAVGRDPMDPDMVRLDLLQIGAAA